MPTNFIQFEIQTLCKTQNKNTLDAHIPFVCYLMAVSLDEKQAETKHTEVQYNTFNCLVCATLTVFTESSSPLKKLMFSKVGPIRCSSWSSLNGCGTTYRGCKKRGRQPRQKASPGVTGYRHESPRYRSRD